MRRTVVERALRAGATEAEVVIREGDEFSTLVRLGQVETLKESGARGIGLRVFLGPSGAYRTANTSTSDFSDAGLAHLVSGAMDLAQVTSQDPFAGLPEASAMGQLDAELDLYYEDVYSLPTAQRIEYARRAEAAALAADPRLKKSDGGSFDAATGHKVMANSRGFVGEYRRSYCSLSAMPIAETEQGSMQRDYWYSSARTLARLDSPESIGAEAARRTLRRLNARRVTTQRVPIVFAPEIARSLISNIFEAANGDSIYRGASFWTNQLGQQVASANVTVIDDGTMPGLFGTAPFDGEGLPTRRTVIVEKGVLKNYLLNTYTARKLNMQSTGNASRGLAGTPGIGAGNLFLEKGTVYATATTWRCEDRVLCHRADGVWRQHGHWRLLPGCSRTLDRERRADLRSGGSHHCREPEGDAQQHHRHRRRPGISGSGGLTYFTHRRNDHRRGIIVSS